MQTSNELSDHRNALCTKLLVSYCATLVTDQVCRLNDEVRLAELDQANMESSGAAYEAQREARIAENKRRMFEMGLLTVRTVAHCNQTIWTVCA